MSSEAPGQQAEVENPLSGGRALGGSGLKDPASTAGVRVLRGAVWAGATLLVLSALLLNQYVAGPLLDAVGPGISDAGVVAVALTAAAGTRLLWHWRCRVHRSLGMPIVFLTLYEVEVLVSYEPPSRAWSVLGFALWPVIPIAYASWGSAMLAIAHQADVPVSLAHDWRRLRPGHPRLARSRVRPGHVLLWVPALVFAGASLVPGLVYSGGAVPGVTWHGQPYHPHVFYAVISVWGVSTLLGSALVAEHVWRIRRLDLDPGEAGLVRGATVVAFVAVSCAIVASLAALTGFWPEPTIDLELAAFATGYALLVTRGTDTSQLPIAWRYVIGENTIALTLALGFSFVTTTSPGMRGLEAGIGTFLVTLLILSVRHVQGPHSPVPVSGLARFPREERESLGDLFERTEVHTIRLYLTGLPTIGSKAVPHSGLSPAQRTLVTTFAAWLTDALGPEGAARFNQLYYDIADEQPDTPTAGRPTDPSPPLLVLLMTSARGAIEPDKAKAETLRVDRKRVRVHRKSEPPTSRPDTLPIYHFQGELDRMAEADLDRAWRLVNGRADARPKQAQGELLETGISMVRDEVLRQIARARDANQPRRRL